MHSYSIAFSILSIAFLFFKFEKYVFSLPETEPLHSNLLASTELLTNFVEDEIKEVAIDDIKFDHFATFGSATCFSANNSTNLNQKLKQELGMVPQKILLTISEKVSGNLCASTETRTSYESSEEVAYIYWKLNCKKNSSEYSMCISVAGANILLAEVQTGTITERENIIVGYEPCKCSVFNAMCRECPIVETVERTKELKKRPKLTLNQHTAMISMLHTKAVQHAKKIISVDGFVPTQLQRTREPNIALVDTRPQT